MTDSNKNPPAELKHYIRPSAQAKEKRLITERVQAGSASFEFLQRMETRRRERECLLVLDMRGKVAYECKRYAYRQHVFWMDDISYQTFLKGLQENQGLFTVGTYEEIMNGEHTFARRKDQAGETEGLVGERSARQEGAAVVPEHDKTAPVASPIDVPEIIPLGYYHDRNEIRLQHSTGLRVRHRQGVLSLRTRNLSRRGLKVYAKHPLPFELGDTVEVAFIQFQEEHGLEVDELSYRVVATEAPGGDEYRACLARSDDEDGPVSRFLERFVEENSQGARRRRYLDYEDERLTALSLLAEQYYTNATPVLPFFLSQAEGAEVALAILCDNENSEVCLEAFRSGDGEYDFTSLSAGRRVQWLHDLAREDGQKDPILAVYRDSAGCPRVVGDFEFPSEAAWRAFLGHHSRMQGLRVFKALVRPTERPDCRKIYRKLERLTEKSLEHAEELLCEADRLVAAGAFIDITDQMRLRASSLLAADPAAMPAALETIVRAELETGPPPALLRFGYVEQRHEDRYRVGLAAAATVRGKPYEGKTRDISIRGMGIELPSRPQSISVGDPVGITLTELHKRAKQRVRLKDIPYEVAKFSGDAPCVLQLKRIVDEHWKPVSEFFRDLIERNAGRILPDLSDSVTATSVRLYAAMAAESTATIPFFVYRDADTGDRSVKVAMPRQPGSFAAFFEIAPGEYDFSFIAPATRLSKLLDGVRKNKIGSELIYLYKTLEPERLRFQITSKAESEFESERERAAFIDAAKGQDFAIVKVLAGSVIRPRATEENSALERLVELIPHHAAKLRSQCEQIQAVGDLVDVTRQVMDVR